MKCPSDDAIKLRYDIEQLERQAQTTQFATPIQVAEIHQLLSIVCLPEKTAEKWFAKGASMPGRTCQSGTLQKCIDFVKTRLPNEATA